MAYLPSGGQVAMTPMSTLYETIKGQGGTRKRIDGQGVGFPACLSLNRGTILLKSEAREGTKKSLSANIPFGVIRRGDDIL